MLLELSVHGLRLPLMHCIITGCIVLNATGWYHNDGFRCLLDLSLHTEVTLMLVVRVGSLRLCRCRVCWLARGGMP